MEEVDEIGNIIECFSEKMTWGHTIQFYDWGERRVVGWMTPLPEVGDELRFRMTSGKIARFTITKMEPCGDPQDMFFADVEDVGHV